MPRLIAQWRSLRGPSHARGPADDLSSQEQRIVARGVRALSDGLTRDRALAGTPYLENPELLGAYLLFYWPVSYSQARSLLSELPTRPITVLDLGSGPGPLAFAALDFGVRDVLACDRSQAALRIAAALAKAMGLPLRTRQWEVGKGIPGTASDLILMGHLLNEVGAQNGAARQAFAQAALARLQPGGTLLIIEPALKETSRGLLEVRDALVASGAAVRFPCFFRGPCPALGKPSDWCHADRPWEPPQVVAKIAAAAGLHKDSVKMSAIGFAPPSEGWAAPPSGEVYRIVSEPLPGKGRRRYIGCGPMGRWGLALQSRHRTEANAPFFELLRGDVVEIVGSRASGEGRALGDSSEVIRLARAGACVNPRPEAERAPLPQA